MIITRLAGGIGNQMFHYAVARKNQRSERERIVLDTRQLRPLEAEIDKIIQRPFALYVFPNLKATEIDTDLADLLESMRLVARFKRRLLKARMQHVYQQYLEPVVVRPRHSKGLWLEGNFQSEEHFVGIRETLLNDFAFRAMDEKNESIKRRILGSPHALSIHLRRGDYQSLSNKPIFDSVTLDYYHHAMNTIANAQPVSTLAGFVFSDDTDWAKANFAPKGLRLEYITGNDAQNSWKDMNLMSCCRHHIIANSSFSWWGAWLSQRGGEKTAPRHWFRPSTYAYQIDHIVPKHWHVVDYELN